jgi:protease IV
MKMASRKSKVLVVIVSVIVLIFVISLVRKRVSTPSGNVIGVVEIEGIISDSKETMEEILKFKEDASIKGVILRINSPGGAVGPSQEIYREVLKLREKKKVFVSMGTTCASGGYYIASAADKLYANPSTITGSIGVIMQLVVVEDLLKKLGLQPNTLKAGKLKDAGSPFRSMTPDERAYMDQVIANIYDQFIKDVSTARKMDVEKVRVLAEGRIYTGTQAQEVGFVDGIGNFYDTVDALKAALGMKGKAELVYAEKPFTLSRWLFGTFSETLSKEVADRIFSSPVKLLMTP